MAHRYGDRVKDTTTTTGTGNITVSGSAPSGFRTLSAVLTGDGDTGDFVIVGGGEWEVVTLTRVSANEYSRGTPFASSNAGAAVDFSAGTKDVFLTLPADLFDDSDYGSGWNASRKRPSQNAVFDALEALIPHKGLTAGRWYTTTRETVTNSGVSAVSANVIYLRPLQIPRDCTISDLAVRIAVASAGQNCQAAIYAMGSDGNPTGNPIAYTGDMSTTNATTVTADIVGDNVAAAAGRYWGGVNSSGTPAYHSEANVATAEFYRGSTTVGNVFAASVGVPLHLEFSQTYNTWPDLTGQSFTEALTQKGAYIGVKAA